MSKVEYWQQHMKGWEASNLPQKRYCEENQLRFHTFQYWRTRLNKNTSTAKNLIPVSVKPMSTLAMIHLGDRIRLEIASHMIADVLVELKQKGLLHDQA